jgi:hypothetical protein
MFVNTTQVKTITGKVVDAGLIERAQYVVEAYIGKFESEITDTRDQEILKRATAYQCAYMLNNEDIVYEQMAVSTTSQNEAATTFKQGDTVSPFIAPMVVIICNRLSFMKPRSIKTGKMGQISETVDWNTI